MDNEDGFNHQHHIDDYPHIIGSGIGDEDDDDNDMDEEAFKEALERAKAAADKLSMRPALKK